MVTATANGQKIGRIIQIIGSTFDAEFGEGHLPEIYNALRVESEIPETASPTLVWASAAV